MEKIVNYILSEHDLPAVAAQYLKGNIVINNLKMQAVLQKMRVSQLKLDVEAGFFYEANVYMNCTVSVFPALMSHDGQLAYGIISGQLYVGRVRMYRGQH